MTNEEYYDNDIYVHKKAGERKTLLQIGKEEFIRYWNISKESGLEPEIYVGEPPKLNKYEYIHRGYLEVTEYQRGDWILVERRRDMANSLTPKRLAYVLIDHWITGGPNPYSMSCSDIQGLIEGFKYRVTENRRNATMEQLDLILRKLKDRAAEEVANLK